MSEQRSPNAAGPVALEVGQPFNPFGLFNGIFIPEALVKAKGVSAGAKITYGRLTRYGGENGLCFPSVPTLAREIGMSPRQTQRYLSELEKTGLIRRLARLNEQGQQSNVFHFLWHPMFADAATRLKPAEVTDLTSEAVTDSSPEGATDSSSKESQSEESQFEEKTTNKRISGYASQKPRSAASSPVRFSKGSQTQKQTGYCRHRQIPTPRQTILLKAGPRRSSSPFGIESSGIGGASLRRASRFRSCSAPGVLGLLTFVRCLIGSSPTRSLGLVADARRKVRTGSWP